MIAFVPRRADYGWRDGLWGYVRGWWAAHDVAIIEGYHDDGPFSRAVAVNEAARTAGDWQCAVIADADTIPESFEQVRTAYTVAAAAGPAVLAYTEHRSLTREATYDVLGGKLGLGDLDNGHVRWANPKAISSCLVVPRGLWDRVGGFDERFRGWGFEDRAFYCALRAHGGPIARVDGAVWHLWHPRSAEKNPESPEYQANAALARRYRDAGRDPMAVDQVRGG